MCRDKLLSMGFVALLLLSMVMVVAAPVSAEPAPAGGGAIWVEPDFVNGSEVGLGNTFFVQVKINISDTAGDPTNPGIYAFSYYFSWNDTFLELVSWNSYNISDGVWEEGCMVASDELKDFDDNGKNDTHSYAASALGMPTAFYGNMTLSDYTFEVVYEPEVEETCNLEITVLEFIDSNEDLLSMTKYDGLYVIPEFPVALIMQLFMVATLAAVILGKKAWLRKRAGFAK